LLSLHEATVAVPVTMVEERERRGRASDAVDEGRIAISASRRPIDEPRIPARSSRVAVGDERKAFLGGTLVS
jgi:hypothetical protein